MIVDINNINKKYDIVYTDPPWQQRKGGIRKCRPNQNRQFDYNTMTYQEIKDFHDDFLKNHVNDNHNVFMWTIDKFLLQTEQLMNELGYSLHARFIWDKGNGIAPAFTVRYTHEYLLWFYKKTRMIKPDKSVRGKYTTVFREKSTSHSTKPIFVYEMLEDMFPGTNRIELFARNVRYGWDSFGDEL